MIMTERKTMQKKYICFLFIALIVVVPLLFRPKFSFDLCYYVDDKLYSTDMYVVTSNKELSIKKNSYVFESVEQGNYSIIVEPYKQDENKIILEFVNCQGYDLMPVRIYMNIEIKIDTMNNIAFINVTDQYDNVNNYSITLNENGEYYVKWSNA